MPKQNIEAVNISAMTAEQRDAALALDVERLLRFGRKHKLIKELDAIVARNTLLDLLGLAQPSEEKVPKEDFDTPAALLDEMVELAAAKGLFDGSVPQYRINFETRMMGGPDAARKRSLPQVPQTVCQGRPQSCHGLVL